MIPVGKLVNSILSTFTKSDFVISREQDVLIRRMCDEIERLVEKKRMNPEFTVLYIPFYYHTSFTRLFDIVFALSLKARGVRIISVLSEDFYSRTEQNVVYGGIYKVDWEKTEKRMVALEHKMWVDYLKTEHRELKDYRTKTDTIEAIEFASNLDASSDEYKKVTYKNYRIGFHAGKLAANMNNLPFVEKSVEGELRAHAENIYEMVNAYNRILEDTNPDAVICNFPCYYKWNVPYSLARERGIPVYTYLTGERKNSFIFNCNNESRFEFNSTWESFVNNYSNNETFTKVDKLINERFKGKLTHFDFYKAPFQDNEHTAELKNWKDASKKLVILPVGVTFDSPVYDSPAFYSNIVEVIEKVTRFFVAHPEYQLIIKAHPAERGLYKQNLGTRYLLKNVLGNLDFELTDNILFLDCDHPLGLTDVLPVVDMGIVCYSSSAMEMSWMGIPVISLQHAHYSGKGFVFEPASEEEFSKMIFAILENEETEEKKEDRKRLSKLWYLAVYEFLSLDFGLLEGAEGDVTETKLVFDKVAALLPGANEQLDYVCKAILEKKPIYDVDRWPPGSENF